jgi:ABC-type transporter Mla subunit MlaD
MTDRFLSGERVVTHPNASETATVNADRPTAAIIAFPTRSKPAEVTPEERLAKALDSLNMAMANQRAAVAGWRAVLGELKTTATTLDESLQQYRSNLRSLSGSVSSLQAKTRVLQQWAEGATSDGA